MEEFISHIIMVVENISFNLGCRSMETMWRFKPYVKCIIGLFIFTPIAQVLLYFG